MTKTMAATTPTAPHANGHSDDSTAGTVMAVATTSIGGNHGDGNRGHAVEPFEGERFSIVSFTAGAFARIKDEKLKGRGGIGRGAYGWRRG